jgi:glycosyltransferase involved in cell wall biosynthesis
MASTRKQILCMHQSAELYGSDRSFLSAIEGLKECDADLEVVLPFGGELVSRLKGAGASVDFYPKGILRKQDLKKPFTFVLGMVAATCHNIRLYRSYDLIYINTVVMFAALIAAGFFRFSNKRFICHVREIPSEWQVKVFGLIFRLSGVELVYNSIATKRAFGLEGTVIYNGVEPTVFDLVDSEGGEVGEECPEFRLLMIGRISTWKGQGLLLDALNSLPDEVKERVRLRVVGSAFEGYEYLEEDLAGKVKEYGLHSQVSFVAFCEDPSEHYLWSDMIVAPSTSPEPFGRVAIEAFSFGKPVIAARHGGLVEIVEDRKNGLLFSPCSISSLQDAIVLASNMSGLNYRAMSKAAVDDFTKRFSIGTYQESLRRYVMPRI